MENLVSQNKIVITKINVSFIFCKTATQTKTIDFEKHHYLVMFYASDLSKKRRLESVISCRIIHNDEALKQNIFNITQEEIPCAFNAPSTNYTGISRRSHLPCKDQGYVIKLIFLINILYVFYSYVSQLWIFSRRLIYSQDEPKNFSKKILYIYIYRNPY